MSAAPRTAAGRGRAGYGPAAVQRLDAAIFRSHQVAEQLDRRIAILHAAFVEQRRRADEIANIGDNPWLAGLDECIFLKLPDILLDEVRLQIDDVKQSAQRFAALLVTLANEGRQQVVKSVALGVGKSHLRTPPPQSE